MERLSEECRELLRWYERQWMEDRERWRGEKTRLEDQVEALAERLKHERESREGEIARVRAHYEDQIRKRDELARKAREERERCARDLEEALARLKVAQHPPLGEGFFRRLAQEQSLWDQVLLGRAQSLAGIQDWVRWLGEEWSWRSQAVQEASAGQPIDWRRLWTGMVLEWGLWAWLEGQGFGEGEGERG